jgi:predicted dehydrogenase
MPRSATSPLLVAVIGCGAFGSNHARVYRELEQKGEPVKLVGVVDSNFARAEAVASKNGTNAFPGIRELLEAGEVHAASVAVPTVHHLAVARELLAGGVDVLIEKPIAATLADADELIALARQHNRVGQVGHLERFNPGVRAALPLVNHPMFFEVHRLSIFSPRALDVDVVLDLMIHDLDIVLSFVDSPVREVRAVGIPVLSDKVDIASVRLEFENGCVANFTASRVSTEKVRKVRFFQPHQYISIDYSRQDVLSISVRPPSASQPDQAPEARTGAFSIDDLMQAMSSPGSPVPPQFAINKPPIEKDEPLRAELRSFLNAVRRFEVPVVTLQDGRRALAVALDILTQIEEHARRAKLQNLPE